MQLAGFSLTAWLYSIRKNLVLWPRPHHYRKAPVSFAVWLNHTAGPSDCFVFIPPCGAPQSCRDFTNSRSLYPHRSAQIVGACAYLKTLSRHLLRCSPNVNGITNLALEGPTKVGSLGPGYLLFCNRLPGATKLGKLYTVRVQECSRYVRF